MVSVIIVTKDRPYDVEKTSLQSLLSQNYCHFEVIVWDASESDETKKICEKLFPAFGQNGVELRYFKAPRCGTVCQRNDAVEYAKFNILFFIDDDSEVSEGGINAVAELFNDNENIKGGALFLVNSCEEDGKPSVFKVWSEHIKNKLYCLLPQLKKRTVNISGSAKGMSSSYPEAEWLSGCCMAYRKSVFAHVVFNERMQVFGGYATGEDIEFSHKVYRKFKAPLLVSSEGRVIHHPAPGSRIADPRRWIASIVFNRFQILKIASGHLFWLGFWGYSWSMVNLFFKMCSRYGFEVTKCGFRLAISEIRSV